MTRSVHVFLWLIVVTGLAIGAYFAYEHNRPKSTPEPASLPSGRLVVLVVFDQMRGDYLARWAGHFGSDGFERMKRDGVWYSDVEIPYACTSTGPGHASLVTGAAPAVHGIIENEWWDRKAGVRVYCCQPSRPFDRVPPVQVVGGEPGRGSGTGFSPENLLSETIGDRLKQATSGTGRVFSLSIKDRSAVLMGGQKPDGVYCFDTRDGTFHTGAFYRQQVHPWVAEFNAARLVDSWFNQNWERVRPDLDYAKIVGHPDDVRGEAVGFNGQGRVFPHPFRGKLSVPGKGYYEAVECSPLGNELLLELAKTAITAEKLGQSDTTDLLCLSFSSNDLAGHQWGPDSWEVFDFTLRTDKLVADLLTFLDTTVGKDRYAVVLSADHGVCPLPELGQFASAARKTVNDFLPGLATRLNSRFDQPTGRPADWFETSDPREQDRLWPWLHLNRRWIESRGLSVDTVATFARDVLANSPHVEAVFTAQQLETEAFAPGSLGAKAKLAYRRDRCGEVLVVPQPGVLVTGYLNGTNHGSPHRYDTHIPVLAVGTTIPKLGKQEQKVSSLIVAPILARSLGIDPPKDAREQMPY